MSAVYTCFSGYFSVWEMFFISLCVHLTVRVYIGMDTLMTKRYMEGHHTYVRVRFNDYNCHGMIPFATIHYYNVHGVEYNIRL